MVAYLNDVWNDVIVESHAVLDVVVIMVDLFASVACKMNHPDGHRTTRHGKENSIQLYSTLRLEIVSNILAEQVCA